MEVFSGFVTSTNSRQSICVMEKIPAPGWGLDPMRGTKRSRYLAREETELALSL
jgi:hypothetical protein